MSLRSQALRGGAYLALRESLGVALSLGGVLVLTRTIGPEQYGLYAAAVGIFIYLQNLSQLGIAVYLVRREGEERLEDYHQAFTLLLLLGLGGMLLGLLGRPFLEGWMRLEGFGAVAQVMFLGLPVTLLSQVPLARLERNLDYKRVAVVELWNQVFYYAVALPMAFQGAGVWAPVIGWWAQQIQAIGLFYWSASYRPRLCWNRALIQEMIGYSAGYSASMWVWQLRTLVNPLIVGRYAGAEAVGYVALAIRLVEMLSFVKSATWRIAIATLARLQGDRVRLVKAVTDGMSLQVFALGPLLVPLSWLGPWLMPLLFGPRWLPVMEIYPFIALSYLSNVLFNMHASVLYVLKQNWEVAGFHLLHIFLFVGSALLLVPHLGLFGYGWAEVIALASYSLLHIYLVRSVGSPDYQLAALWWMAFAAALFSYKLGWWTSLGLVGIALLPATQKQVLDLFKTLRQVKS